MHQYLYVYRCGGNHCTLALQATRLRSKLVEQKIPEEALWVTSPLTRAIDTLILACPHPHRLGSPPLAQAGPSASTSQPSRPLKLVVRRLVASPDWSSSVLLAYLCQLPGLYMLLGAVKMWM